MSFIQGQSILYTVQYIILHIYLTNWLGISLLRGKLYCTSLLEKGCLWRKNNRSFNDGLATRNVKELIVQWTELRIVVRELIRYISKQTGLFSFSDKLKPK